MLVAPVGWWASVAPQHARQNDMDALKTAIAIAWIIFWVYWLVSALARSRADAVGVGFLCKG